MQIVLYSICIITDAERVSFAADKQLQEMANKYPEFIHMKSMYVTHSPLAILSVYFN